MKQMYFAVQHNDPDICRKSSSGGAFTAITEEWFNAFGEDAVVYGCVMDEQMQVRHARAVNAQQAEAMRGSKYVGSNTSGVYRQVEDDLKSGKYVCFSGTPCQVAALKAYLHCKNVETDQRLLTLEVICHGVGSTRFFEDYIADQERKYRSKVTFCSFRGKMRPGKRQQMVLRFANGKVHESPSARYDEFLSAYGRNDIIRPSCFSCPYAKWERQADITIGDSWGEYDALKSVRTLVILGTPWGAEWFNRSGQLLQCREISREKADQPQLNKPADKPAEYDRFWQIYREKGFMMVQVFLGNWTVSGRIRRIIGTIVYHLHLVEGLQWVSGHILKEKEAMGGAQNHDKCSRKE